MTHTRTLPLYVLVLVALLAVGAAAQGLPEINYEKYELPNGLDVILHQDNTVPMVTVNIYYHVGSKNERPGRTGFAHLFEHMMFQGSQNSPGDYINRVERMGGDLNASTWEDKTVYYNTVPSNNLEEILFLESDRMGFLIPAMTQEKLDNQREVVKNERRQRLDNEPYAKSYELQLSLLYPKDHPYSWSVIGSMEDLNAASIEDVSEFFRLYYAPNNASLCIAGDFDPAQAKQWVEKYFGPIPAGEPISRMKAWTPTLTEPKRAVAEDRVSLPRLYYFWHTPGLFQPGDAEFDLLANILSSGKTSRLYKALVYEQQIAQDVSAAQYSKELSGDFSIEVTLRPGRTFEEAEKAVDAELQKIFTAGVTPNELTQAQTNYEAGFVRQLQTAQNKASQLNTYNVQFGDPNLFQKDLDRYMKATPADIQKSAKEYLNFDQRAILHIVPAGEYSSADIASRPTEPKTAPKPDFVAPVPERATLSNGLELYVVEDHRLPLVQTNLLVKAGWGADPSNLFGLGSMTAELLDEGTKTRSALEISEEAKSLGAYLSTGSGYDASWVNLNVLKRNLDKGLTLMSDVVLNPTFPADELDRRRQIYLGRLQQENHEPSTMASKTFYRLLYGENSAYGQSNTGTGTEASLKALTSKDAQSFYATYFKPNNAALIMVGDITMAEAKAKAEKFFGGWKAGEVPAVQVPQPKQLAKTTIYIVDKPGAPQSVIRLGHAGIPRNAQEYLAVDVMNGALGGQFAARINLNLREDKGYTYGAYSGFGARKAAGHFTAVAPVQTEVTKESIAELVKEIRDITNSRPVSEKELTQAKNNMANTLPLGFTTLGGVAEMIGTLVQYGLPENEWQTYMQRVNDVDVATATRMAKNFLKPESLLIVVVGDRQKIEGEIRELSLGDVVTLETAQL